MSRLCLGYLILLHLASCTSIKFKNNKMTDCELLSKIIQQIGIIDEKQCNDTITLCVDTFDRSYLYTYDLGKREYVYKKWDFTSCNNFKIEDNTVIKILQPAYKLMHGDLVDHRMHPPTTNICYNINISTIDKYKNWYKMSFGIENASLDGYGGIFLFNLDKYGNISNLHIWYYIKNQNSKSGLDLSKKYPKYIQKPRY